MRPGANWNPVLKASDPSILEVATPQPDISTGSATVQFRAIRPGISNLVVTAVTDVELPRPATVVVRGRQFSVNRAIVTARGLQQFVDFRTGFGSPNPIDVAVTVSSSDSSLFLVSPSFSETGSPAATIPAGKNLRVFVQGVKEGTATLTFSAPAFDDLRVTARLGSPLIR